MNENDGLNRLGEIRDSDGNTVVEMFSAPNALTKNADIISQCLYTLTEIIVRGLMPDKRGGGLGGEFGYGVQFENDTFSTWPDYQGCNCFDPPQCADSCAIRIWNIERLAAGRTPEPKSFWESAQIDFSAMFKWQESHPSPICTCGKQVGWIEPTDHLPDCCLREWNFIHKASDLRIRWYKWIGRDMQMNRDEISGQEWAEISNSCIESIPLEAREKAQRAHDFENTAEYRAEKEQIQKAMSEAMWRTMNEEGTFGG